MVQGFGFRVYGLRFRVSGLGALDRGRGFRVWGSGGSGPVEKGLRRGSWVLGVKSGVEVSNFGFPPAEEEMGGVGGARRAGPTCRPRP